MNKILETTIQFFPVNETSMEYLLNHVVLGLVCTYWGDTKTLHVDASSARSEKEKQHVGLVAVCMSCHRPILIRIRYSICHSSNGN